MILKVYGQTILSNQFTIFFLKIVLSEKTNQLAMSVTFLLSAMFIYTNIFFDAFWDTAIEEEKYFKFKTTSLN